MKKTAVILVFCLFLSAYPLWAPSTEKVIVVFHNTPDVTLLSQYGTVDQVFHLIPAAVVTLPEHSIQLLAQNAEIRYIQPDYYIQFVQAPQNEADQLDQVIPWGVDRIDADRAWRYSTGKKVKVAVIDTGIDIDHPDLEANIYGGINTIDGYQPDDYDDDHGHGTCCAGIIAAANNDIGVIGVAPDAWLYSVKVLNLNGSGYVSDIIEGIEWCVDKEMQVINMSFGGGYNPAIHDACDAAWDSGCILAASIGYVPTGYPAAYSSVIAVAVTDRNDYQGYEYGPELELVAPGEEILTTGIGGGYVTVSGVSFGCPHVSGTAALVIAVNPNYSNGIVRRILQMTAEDLGAPGWDPYYGFGLVDAEAAVTHTGTVLC